MSSSFEAMGLGQVNPDWVPTAIIPAACVIGILFAIWSWKRVAAVPVTPGQSTFRAQGREYLLEEEQRGDDEVRLGTRSCAPTAPTHVCLESVSEGAASVVLLPKTHVFTWL